jgi:hypothetical protein
MPGDYTLCVQDQKGCESQIDVTVLPSNGFTVEAGDTLFVNLGETVDINAVAVPSLPSTVTWNFMEHLSFDGEDVISLLNPTALPPRTGWYVVTITNDAGCVTSDSVLIIVEVYKPIFIPNVISANADGINDQATVYGNIAATSVRQFQFYDRWGGLLWERLNFDLNDPSLGWDGTQKDGKPVNPGVYTYIAIVDFLDEIPLTFHGTVTVLR